MKKTFKNVMMLVTAMTLSLGFASCSDDNDDPKTNSDIVPVAELAAVSDTYVNDVVYPTYQALRDNSKTLHEACAKLYANAKAGSLSDADVEAACEAFKNARLQWERSEAFLYGAATDHEIDPHIDTWPLDHDQLVEALNDATVMDGIKNQGSQYVFEKNGKFDSTLGFHGLEFVLFRNGAARKAADFAANETEEGMTSVAGIDELAFADAVSGDIYNMTTLLHYGWTQDNTDYSWINNNCKWVLNVADNNEEENTHTGGKNGLCSAGIGYGAWLLKGATQDGWFTTWQETLENACVAGCSNICQEVYTQKLGQAFRVASGQGGTTEDGEKESRDYIESPYSKRSYIDYQDNIYSIKNSLYGTRDVTATTPVTNSMMNIMKKYNYSGYNDINTALNEAIAALETAKNSSSFVADIAAIEKAYKNGTINSEAAYTRVKTCIDKINNLDDELNKAGAWFRKIRASK